MIIDPLRLQLNRELTKPLSETEWRYLDNKGFLRRCRVGDLTPGGVAAEIEQLRGLYGDGHPAPQFAMLKDRGGEATPARIDAISELVAQEAKQNEAVQSFRSDILKGLLLSREDVQGWILQQAESDGPGTLFITAPLPAGSRLDVSQAPDGRFGLVPEPPLTIDARWPAEATSERSLDYGDGRSRFVRRVPVASGGVLDRLRALSEQLAQQYGWQPAQATVFVLTGFVPLVGVFRVSYSTKDIPALARITLTVDPALSPAEVARHYREVRKRFVGTRHRSMSEKHSTLVLFMNSRPAGETYAVSMAAWNKAHRKWKYRHVTNFGRDVQVARQRLLGAGPSKFRVMEMLARKGEQQ